MDEVALGWRGESMDSAAYFGLAMGRFQPDKFAEAFEQGAPNPVRHAVCHESGCRPQGSTGDRATLYLRMLDP